MALQTSIPIPTKSYIVATVAEKQAVTSSGFIIHTDEDQTFKVIDTGDTYLNLIPGTTIIVKKVTYTAGIYHFIHEDDVVGLYKDGPDTNL